MNKDKATLTKDGTMQVTAKEGIDYLKSEGKTRLLKAQGLIEDKPGVHRDNTMVNTAKEAESILGDNKPDVDAQTRGQNKQIEDLKNEPEPPVKKSKLTKNTTMAATAKEAKTILAGEKLGDTRQVTSEKKRKTPLKKDSTMKKTLEDAKWVVGDIDANSARKTRSQSRGDGPKPSLKKAGTMQNTAKEGKEFLKRGKGKKGAQA